MPTWSERLSGLARFVRADRVAAQPPAWRTVEQGPLAGLSFLLPTGTHGWADRIINGSYEPETVAALGEFAARGGTLYDIGAHIGFISCMWIRLGGRAVDAFEPLPANARVLRENLARNGMSDKVRVHECAIGAVNADARLLAHDLDLGATSMAYLEQGGGIHSQQQSERYRLSTATTVRLRRLDDVAAEEGLDTPAALKIDVEGAEADVLAGARALVTRHRPAILCEIHNIDSGLRVSDCLARLNYAMSIVGPNRLQPIGLWRAD